ncbi:hypothetical protein ACHHYP_06183 [Achlya hypogyna]|uniref:Secreted protein n=1 Tax=Achlya hypogyna TaxID=1202772 RepID=A0A0A7CNB5_ACHHY|nr:secreted protein [Achlya hypogyna]OQR89596.1 hypothetical protein ACHHYP_06183 [Achlya hypogyna]
MKTVSVVLLAVASVVVGRCGSNYDTCSRCCESSMFECIQGWCQPTWGSVMNAQADHAGLWAQCGGKGFTGRKACPAGATCVKVNEYYSQCQATATDATHLPTYAQCGGTNNQFNAHGKSCRDEDECFHFNQYFWQCLPKTVVYNQV